MVQFGRLVLEETFFGGFQGMTGDADIDHRSLWHAMFGVLDTCNRWAHPEPCSAFDIDRYLARVQMLTCATHDRRHSAQTRRCREKLRELAEDAHHEIKTWLNFPYPRQWDAHHQSFFGRAILMRDRLLVNGNRINGESVPCPGIFLLAAWEFAQQGFFLYGHGPSNIHYGGAFMLTAAEADRQWRYLRYIEPTREEVRKATEVEQEADLARRIGMFALWSNDDHPYRCFAFIDESDEDELFRNGG